MSASTWEKDRAFYLREAKTDLAQQLNRLAKIEQEGARRRAYMEALDDIASSFHLKREETVTYSA